MMEIRTFFAFAPAFAAGVLLAACVYWDKPGATPDQRDAAMAECNAVAYTNVQPNFQTVQTGGDYVAPATHSCIKSRDRNNRYVECEDTPSQYVPPEYSSVDMNEPARDHVFDTCMYRHGWLKK
jgi:hypothetical protein